MTQSSFVDFYAALGALEDELLRSSNTDKYASATLYLVDLLRELECQAQELRGRLPWVPDNAVRAHLKRSIEAIETVRNQTQAMLDQRISARRAPVAVAVEELTYA